jgi:CheY-like chemotaxis protein
LIVEDDVIIAMDIESRLKNLGYSVPAITSSGKEAVQKVEEHHPALVLMDIVLKGEMDGIDAAEIIRSRFGVPVIFLTTFADEKRMVRRTGHDAAGELCYKTMHGLDEKCSWCVHGKVMQGKHVKMASGDNGDHCLIQA